MAYLAAAGVWIWTGATIWLCCYFGGKWVDRMLCVPPPRDPNEPIVLPHAQDRFR